MIRRGGSVDSGNEGGCDARWFGRNMHWLSIAGRISVDGGAGSIA